MLRVARLLVPRQAVLVEAQRGRKSRNDPVAKSKVGRVKLPPPVDPVEMVVLRERYADYKLITRALRFEFKEEVLRRKYEEETGSMAEERARQEAEEHNRLMAFNQQENQRLLQLRLERMEKETEEAERDKLEAALQREQQQQQFIKQKQEEIQQLQEEAKNFITLDNLDRRIEEALDNPKNYNFAVDKEGRVVKRTVLQ
ncbi:28S ribosomal protein S26, mitochondrial [Corythoichthys intestinalis]|uniref:28S ribosomal protein S26, mitochondrial n=1 Tax=Corythoichthys intestinalis TaxID=161448 RepID=UPI0025A67852|nr:28S ribosomal protein S26, mitochondrial [Corythoichthys intestinalis]XP_061798764.1 small ribosomal subunit protein mS26-like [Nerophis lumbriciformis]